MSSPVPKKNSSPYIVMIGGGTGSFTLLQELKNFTPNISALVNMSDDGGSTGRLRDEYGVLPAGDVRQCLVALSRSPDARDVFNYRFGANELEDSEYKGLEGHSVGNLILASLELRYKDFAKAVQVAGSLLNIAGEVIPITTTNTKLVMFDDGDEVEGEFEIAHRVISDPDAHVELRPAATINPAAAAAIAKADLVVIAPGNFYGSLLPALIVDGVADALRDTKAKKVMVSNLVTKPGQTDDWHVADYVRAFEKYIGEGQIDIVLYNTGLPDTDLLKKYAADKEFPVSIDPEGFKGLKTEAIGADLLSATIVPQDKHDTAVPRTLIRHDSHKVSRQLMRIFYS